MAKKSNKTIYLIIGAVILVVVAVTAVLVITNKNKDGGSSSSDGGSSSSYKVSSAELKNPDVKVSYGDYDAMKALSSDIQNGRMTGKVVEIDGLVSHPGQSYSIVQADADGKQKIGTVFNIEDSSEYPKDGAHIVITAKVLEKSALNYQLFTLKEFVREK
ncbi:hypothetical protein IJG27_01485 [Candidatus Saccharibacteria bacterium]|nr:hypothetical protein [Candidatus Saccharibacteria bacterium]